MRTHSGNNYRGIPNQYYDAGNPSLGTGGNQPVNSKTGGAVDTGTNQWHPTVLYLLGLLVIEWAAFIVLTKYL